MKTKKIAIIFLATIGTMCLSIRSLYAQTVWSEINVANVLSFQFPPTLELRDQNNTTMKQLQNGVNQYIVSRGGSISDYRVTLQPKGFNTQGSSLYARVIVNINVDAEVNGTELNGLTTSDIKEADSIFKQQFQSYGVKGSWLGTTYKKYGGKNALVSHYDRAGISGDVHVDDYHFYLKNYLVEITISYRKSESEYWNSDFNKIPSTLKFF